MDSEDQLVNRITSVISKATGGTGKGVRELLRLGIGDDAAVISPTGKTDLAISCDAFLEGVHFLPNVHPADSVGYKSLSRATSDLAAMGAIPRFFLLTLALPASRTGAWLDKFLRGMGRAAGELGMRLAGGNTTNFSTVSISITVLGEVPRGFAVTRSGAKPGDRIYVSGRLGRAQLGLDLIRSRHGRQKRYAAILQPHLYPRIRVDLGAWLARNRVASAMMDISDGLSTDLLRLCKASGVGARLDSLRIPCVEIPAKVARLLSNDHTYPQQMALHGGDDYELLFTVPPQKLKHLKQAPGSSGLTSIGEVTAEKKLLITAPDGSLRRLRSLGWDPFAKV
jgi:thiamine-monophosphate kinase